MMFSATAASGAFVRSGKLRALAITSAERTEGWKMVPTVAESGIPGFQVHEWNGLFAPAGTPQPVLDRLEAETRAIVAEPDTQRRFADLGVQAVGSTSREFTVFLSAETAKWAGVIRSAGVKID